MGVIITYSRIVSNCLYLTCAIYRIFWKDEGGGKMFSVSNFLVPLHGISF